MSTLENLRPNLALRGSKFAFLCCVSLSLLSTFASRLSYALDSGRRISQYGHSAWRVQDGSIAVPGPLTQTPDGYIWIGTSQGLVRFDGVRFAPQTTSKGMRLPQDKITSLLAARDGSLWIGTTNGLSNLKDGEVQQYSETVAGISDIIEDHAGVVWVTRYAITDGKGPLCRVAPKALQCYGKLDGIPVGYAVALSEDSLGNLWIGAYVLCRWKPGSSKIYFQKEPRDRSPGVLDIVADPFGPVWVALERVGPHLGVRHYVAGKWNSYVFPGFDSSSIKAQCLYLDRSGALWIGTQNQGLYRIRDRTIDHYRSADGLSGDSVTHFYEDREGNLWVTTNRGLDFFRDTPVVSISLHEGLSAADIRSVFASHDGTVWVGAEGALDLLRKGKASVLARHDGLPGDDVTALFEDHTGRLWMGVDEKLIAYDHGNFFEVRKMDGSALGAGSWINAIAEDVDHNVWALVVGSVRLHLFRIVDQRVREEITLSNIPYPRWIAADKEAGIWIGSRTGQLTRYRNGHLEIISLTHGGKLTVESLLVDSDNSLWTATNNGLYRWKDGRLDILDIRNGLPCAAIFSVLKDNRGFFWLYSQCGLLKIAASELEDRWKRADARVSVEVFAGPEGVDAGRAASQPRAAKSPDGRLWFTNGILIHMIDPGQLHKNTVPPPVHIEEIVADRNHYRPYKQLQLPPLTRDLEVDYTALSFPVPQKIHFRYKLEGLDTEWQDAGTRREAIYTNLTPGSYRFHVIACNNDGVWNDIGAALSLIIAPAWYQTVWFKSLCVLGAAGIIWSLYLLRLQEVTQQIQMRLGERLVERERIARELHDTLLQSFQGLVLRFQGVLDRMPDHDPTRQIMESALDRADEVLIEGRLRVRDLRPESTPENELSAKLASCGEELAQDFPISFNLAVVGMPHPLNPVVRDEAYRIGREALINAFRHSRASQIEVEITYDRAALRLRIRDDGAGIVHETMTSGRTGHWGLSGMRERAQTIGCQLNIWSNPGMGTEVDLTVPAKVAYSRIKKRTAQGWIKHAIRRWREDQ
jgi:signal transduction histidine kinase/ligand-binding sensor domain-containing protein